MMIIKDEDVHDEDDEDDAGEDDEDHGGKEGEEAEDCQVANVHVGRGIQRDRRLK